MDARPSPSPPTAAEIQRQKNGPSPASFLCTPQAQLLPPPLLVMTLSRPVDHFLSTLVVSLLVDLAGFQRRKFRRRHRRAPSTLFCTVPVVVMVVVPAAAAAAFVAAKCPSCGFDTACRVCVVGQKSSTDAQGFPAERFLTSLLWLGMADC